VRILIAPDKFKGALNAREVGEGIACGLHDVLPHAKIEIVPMADGGEGTAEVISEALGGRRIRFKTHDPLGREVEAYYGWIEKPPSAVMEMSEAVGMRRLHPNELNPEIASTFGVGEMIMDAANRGARVVLIGLGGSATNDGGFGMARALGFHFFGNDGTEIRQLLNLIALQRIEKSIKLKLPIIVAAVDVKNPLLGANGATRVFGPQKGVTPDKIHGFERALTQLADVIAKQFGFDYRNEPGAGAAGGLGFGLASFCNARIRPGFDEVAKAVALERKMKGADVVITGEGSLDRQTLEGKTPAGVAQLARKLGKRVFAFVGRATEDQQVRELFDAVFENAQPGMSTEENMKHASELLRDNARHLAQQLNKTSNRQRPTPDLE
jgi:glycerate 2-kinase